jgi:hypothetical protein
MKFDTLYDRTSSSETYELVGFDSVK